MRDATSAVQVVQRAWCEDALQQTPLRQSSAKVPTYQDNFGHACALARGLHFSRSNNETRSLGRKRRRDVVSRAPVGQEEY